jgi:hypothetical protein
MDEKTADSRSVAGAKRGKPTGPADGYASS